MWWWIQVTFMLLLWKLWSKQCSFQNNSYSDSCWHFPNCLGCPQEICNKKINFNRIDRKFFHYLIFICDLPAKFFFTSTILPLFYGNLNKWPLSGCSVSLPSPFRALLVAVSCRNNHVAHNAVSTNNYYQLIKGRVFF